MTHRAGRVDGVFCAGGRPFH